MDAFELLMNSLPTLENDKKKIKEGAKRKAKATSIIQIEEAASFEPDYFVYTDGSCSKNGSASAAAGIGIYFGEGDPRNLSKRVEGKQTNNTAELGAMLEVYRILESDIMSGKKIGVVSDSEYAIRCVTTYGAKCAAKGWSEPIPNKELVKRAYELYKGAPHVKFFHVMAHTAKSDMHSVGNDAADRLANAAVGGGSGQQQQGPKKVYLNVPFAQKDIAKGMGARWDAGKKRWYIMEDCPQKEEVFGLFCAV